MAIATVMALGLAAPTSAAPGEDDEGGTPALRQQLDAATKGFEQAKVRLANSRKRQKQLSAQLVQIEAELKVRSAVVGQLADVAYRGGRAGAVSALLDSDSPDALLDRVKALDTVAANQNEKLRALLTTQTRAQRAKAALAREIAVQQRQVAIMAARKKQAEAALAAAGRNGEASNGPGGSGGGSARPAPRNPDGSFPNESCRLDDPTTGGCITARTLHALRQAKAAGFTRFVSCFRSGGGGDHPLGQACDFAAQRNGFGGVATGGDRTYGNNLANYFVRNADRLGVKYVIWFQEIWLPSSGWRQYSRGNGDPASEHQNHVHLSVF
ncbi:MAG TPA: hypothetical protein VFT95_05140 [Micromonosporaceae bacterium]|nr:hypothetical protein [Micromonosporaceae bacterium]